MSGAVTVTLLPCPFCGGEASINSRSWNGYHFAECESCAIGMPSERTVAEAIAAWNTRHAAEAASKQQIAELVEAANAIVVFGASKERTARLQLALARAKATEQGEG